MVGPRDRPMPSRTLHILISTGEVSGDLQGSYLVQALYRQASHLGVSLTISALGGQRMVTAGAELLGDTTGIGSVGILEALPYLLPTLGMKRRVQQFLQQTPIDLAIFLDYMGPNLGLGNYFLKHYPDIPTAYYIAPQQWVWAFSENDTRTLVAMSDQMVAVFPQEAQYYQSFGADVRYFGHPLVDKLSSPPSRAAARQTLDIEAEAEVITLLPASRRQEVKYVLPIMLAAAERIQAARPEAEFIVPISMDSLRPAIAAAIAKTSLRARLITGHSLAAIAAADLVLNKSGTANLEVALLNIPQVVIYRLNPLTARIAYYLLNFNVDFVSPVNLFVNKGIVPEFIQWEATADSIAAASLKLLQDDSARADMLANYGELQEKMGQPGVCDRVASHLLTFALTQQARILGTSQPEPTG